MWNFQRIICIWICCVSCMFGTTQLSSLVQAVPYEYFDDHEQSFYDLDSEQIQAKYDTRLLSQQMLQTEQQQQQHLENLKGFLNYDSGARTGAQEGGLNIAGSDNTNNKFETRKQQQQNDAGPSSYLSTTTTKLKSNDGQTLKNVGANSADADDDDDDGERNDWLEETATKAAASTSAITETLDELHLPRAASCYTNGQKYTHGQKVPRLDNCEVCLCMDGEIFCWWEKCDKKSAKLSTTYDDYSTPFEESSTTRIQLNPKTTYKTTLKPMKKPKTKTNEDYKYDDDDSAEIREMQQEYEGLKEQLLRTEHVQQEQHKIHHNKQMVKKKIYQQQEEEKHNKKIKEQNKKKQEEEQHHKQQHKTSEHFEQQQQHHHPHNHNNNNNNNHDYGSSGSSSSSSSSKILNFPENLPSVLYYDYKTEEHHQHQHQHREQHLKHQKQKQQQKLLLQQQHEKELKHRQQQQQQQQQHHVNRHHEYGQDFNTYSSNTAHKTPGTLGRGPIGASGSRAGDETKHHDGTGGNGGPSTTFKYFSNGNENIYNGDLQTDSDILPEPPTKKPKYPTSITDTTATAKTTGIPISQLHRLSTSMMATTAVAITKSPSSSSNTTWANTPPTASMPLKKQIFSPWDYNKPNTDKINNNNGNSNNNNNNNNESTEDIIDTDDQDDAFHRWLTSTETNNKNNFTLNDAISGRDVAGGFALAAAVTGTGGGGGSDAAGGGSGLLDVSNSDYNVDDRNYENFDLDTETKAAGLSTAITKTKATLRPLTTMGAAAAVPPITTINAFDVTGGGGAGGGGRPVAIYDDNGDLYENSQKPKYEQNFSDNNSYNNNGNSNGIINSNGNNNISPFSNNPYQNYNNRNNNNNNMDRPNSSIGSGNMVISSTTSNEDNGVASVVNIDIMLTASSADSQQQQQQEQPQETNIETTSQQRQLQQDFEHEKQIAKTQLKFMQPPTLISNTNDVDNNNNNNNKNPLYSIINDNTKNYNKTSSSSTSDSDNSNQTITNIVDVVGNGLNIEERRTALQKTMGGVNLSSSDNSTATTHSLSSSSDSFSFNHISAAVVSQTNNATSATTVEASAASAPPPLSTTLSPERQCNVMGTLYKIGDILPQDTGNCLQCICIDGSTSDDTPRVTCSPHNCPPLVLPDLFDATGY